MKLYDEYPRLPHRILYHRHFFSTKANNDEVFRWQCTRRGAVVIIVLIVVFVLPREVSLTDKGSEVAHGVANREIIHIVTSDLEEAETLVSDKVASRSLSSLSSFNDPSTVEQKNSIINNYDSSRSGFVLSASQDQRSRCQIVYILGVEGTMHHGISPVIIELAKQQSDPKSGNYHVQFESRHLRYGLFGWPQWVGREFNFDNVPAMDDPILVQKTISAICPDNGHHHVVIEGASFPAGDDRVNTHLRVRRSIDWQNMSPEEIAVSQTALNHPINLDKFYDAYHAYAEIKFIVLHRPYLETIASHPDHDSGPITHSNIIQGFLILLSRFLDRHRYDKLNGEKVWTILFTEELAVQFYGPRSNRENWKRALEARRDMLRELAFFLGWPQPECKHCFVTWQDSRKAYEEAFSRKELNILRQHMKSLEGVWPPVESSDMT
ncbi:hypothetical protein HJC23_009103 [Cyclotella cryptica]|uniref:Uncharacterized protein n=1 Tax=Cyclotella cryptica TaxID=29204 RepID=A0ABD3R087_9STRA|eukprot:CCRYP_000727-RA/>CCRYP_000727-RA protein AED:0.03 eAED:0.03 QI:163/1/1/1/1/1/2/154/436